MNDKNNIESLFKESLGGFNAKPSEKVWTKVQHGVMPARIKYIVKSTFSGFRSTPGSKIWGKINAKLVWHRFLYFKPYSFNIYNVAAIVTITAGTITAFNLTRQKEEKIEKVISHSHYVQPINSFSPENQRLKYTTQSQTGSANILSASESIEQTQLSKESAYLHHNSVAQLAVSAHEGFDTPIPNASSAAAEKSFHPTPERMMFRKIFPFQNYRPDPAYWSNLNFLDYEFRQPVIPDTIGVDFKGDPIVVAGSYLSLEPGYSLISGRTQLKSSNPEIDSHYREKLPYKPEYSYMFGLNVALQEHHLRFIGGINYAQYNETYRQPETKMMVHNSFEYEYNNYTAWVNDTTWILDLEAWIQGDTVYFVRVDSVLCNITDSSLLMLSDTSFTFDTVSYRNRFTYVEIPLIVGYSFNTAGLIITPQTGFIFGFLNGASGSYPTSLEQSYAVNNLYPLRQFIPRWYAGLNLRWYFAGNFGVLAEPWFTADMQSLYKKEIDINRSDFHYGIRFGLSVRL